MTLHRLTHEERQIRDAFIDGVLSGAFPTGFQSPQEEAEARRDAAKVWRTENTTNYNDDVRHPPEADE